jgi:pimeloyl-ACP methyl ester carboxylesterase
MGHSLGAHAVSAYASFYPSRVEHLYLVSPVGVGYCDNPSPTFFGSYLAYFILETFWNSGYFTLDFVRLAG